MRTRPRSCGPYARRPLVIPHVNISVYAPRGETVSHAIALEFLSSLAEGDQPFGLSEPVLQGFVRVVANPRIFRPASKIGGAFRFAGSLVCRPQCVLLRPGPEHWRIFRRLCESTGAAGKLSADAAHAALAIETGCEWVTTDTDFARFEPALRWRLLSQAPSA